MENKLNRRAVNLILYAKGRYPRSDELMRDVAVILGHYAGVDESKYDHELIAKIVVEDLGELIQKTCNKVIFGEFLIGLGPNHPHHLSDALGFYGALVSGMFSAVTFGTTTEKLEAYGVVFEDIDAEINHELTTSKSKVCN